MIIFSVLMEYFGYW